MIGDTLIYYICYVVKFVVPLVSSLDSTIKFIPSFFLVMAIGSTIITKIFIIIKLKSF